MPRQLIGKTIKSYNITKQLGAGAFAVVFEGVDSRTNELVAIKVMQLSSLNKRAKLKQLCQTQIAVLKGCHNNNVIRFIDSFQTKQFLFIVTEFCNGGDLEELVNKQKKLPESQAVAFLKQILNGFKGLHEVGAMHRDFKAANILLHDGECKIADLGFSKQLQQNSMTKTILGTSLTMAPEVLSQMPYGFQADIWSIGVVFYQMIYGKYPYNAKNDYALLKVIKDTRPKYDEVNISQQSQDFIEKCLTVDPKKRISWKQIYEHPLIIEKNKRFLTTGTLKSQLSLNANRSFYQTLASNAMETLNSSSKQIKLQVLPDYDIRATTNVSQIQKQALDIKKREQRNQRFGSLYVGRRNDIMIFNRFIHPFITKLTNMPNMRINHSVAGFILSKKLYTDLAKLQQNLLNKKNIFYGQEGFQEFCNSPIYDKLLQQINNDVLATQKVTEQYKSSIKLTTLQIIDEYDIKLIKNVKFTQMMNDIINQYSRLLSQSLIFVKGQARKDVITIIHALNYIWRNQKPKSNEYERMFSSLNFVQFQKSLQERSLKL